MNLTDEVIATVSVVARQLASIFTLGYYEPEDMEQECWVYALEYLNWSGASLSQIYTHLRNRLLGLKRSMFHKGERAPAYGCGRRNRGRKK